MKQEYHRWCVLWRQTNNYRHFIFDKLIPVQFMTKREAQEYIKEKYGYIAKRKDLREEPFGWRMPTPIKVKITIQERK